MAWFRQELDYISHPKFIALSDGSFRLWHEGKCWVEANLTDGILPISVVKGFRYFRRNRTDELVSVPHGFGSGLWDVVDGVGYKMHDYLYFNPSKDEVLARRDNAIEKKRRDRDRLHERRMSPRHRRDIVTDESTRHRGDIASDIPSERQSESKRERKSLTEAEKYAPPLPVETDERPKPGKVFNGGGAASKLKAKPSGHRGHYMCGPNQTHCVVQVQHADFVNGLKGRHGGSEADARDFLECWYVTVWSALRPDDVDTDLFKFWREQFAAAFSTNRKPAVSTKAPRPRNCSHQPECADDAAHTSKYLREMELSQ